MILGPIESFAPLIKSLVNLVYQILITQPLSFKLGLISEVKDETTVQFPKVESSEVGSLFFHLDLSEVARY